MRLWSIQGYDITVKELLSVGTHSRVFHGLPLLKQSKAVDPHWSISFIPLFVVCLIKAPDSDRLSPGFPAPQLEHQQKVWKHTKYPACILRKGIKPFTMCTISDFLGFYVLQLARSSALLVLPSPSWSFSCDSLDLMPNCRISSGNSKPYTTAAVLTLPRLS